MDEPDVDSVFKDENVGKLLKPDDRKILINFAYNLKSRRRKEEEELSSRAQQERVISEKGKMFVNQKTYELHQALMMPMSEVERR
jgi:hypothetical protein